MKKILLTTLVVLSAFVVRAQDEKFRFGEKIGLNLTNLSGDITDSKMKTGFHVGLVFEYKFSDNLSLQPEVIFSTQGYKKESTDPYYDTRLYEKTKLNYFNVPVLFKYNNLGVKGLGIGVGPQLGLLVSAKYYTEITNFSAPSLTEKREVDAKDYLKTVDFAVAFNLEYELKFGLFFQGRYNLGLSNINDGFLATDYQFSNSVFQISTGYKF